MKTKQKILWFFEYAVILFVILDTSTVYSSAFDIDFHILEVATALLTVSLALRLSLFGIKKSTVKKYLNRISFYYMVVLFLFVINVRANMISYIARFVLILPLLILYFYCLAEKGDTISLVHNYVNIMAVLSAISLFFWIFASQLHLIAPTGSLRSGWGAAQYGYVYPSYFGLYFERQKDTFLWYSGFRNQGIFAEGPMFSLCLVLAIAAELFLPKQKASNGLRFYVGNGKSYCINGKLVCLITALITTFTTTGQILLILMLVFRFFMNRPKIRFNYVVKLLVGLTLAVVGAYAAVSIFLLKSTSSSWLIRLDDFIAGFRAWLSSPIWGNGYGDITVVDPYRVSYHTTGIYGGLSNSITLVLAQGGLLFLLIYVQPVYQAVRTALQQGSLGVPLMVVILTIEFVFTIYASTLVSLFFLAFLHGTSISSPIVESFREGISGKSPQGNRWK